MPLWQLASVVFFAYVAVIAIGRGAGAPANQRALAASCGGLLVAAIGYLVDARVLDTWIWPPLLLLIAYWSSGLLFVAPHARQEEALAWLDEQLGVREWSRRTPSLIAHVIEAAYAGVYALVPLALVVSLIWDPAADPDRFWAVVLITDYVCFGVLPWIQTRPPRALENADPWSSPVRTFNLRLLGATSIQVNTFPSGHAAEALVAVLFTLAAPPIVLTLTALAALAVSAGAVLGRYHYLIDVLAGWGVAIVVFMLVRG
jgi:membrane-associated phospholipid phosphatase